MLQNLSLRGKLTITVLLIGLVVGGVNIYQIISVERINNLTKELTTSDIQGIDALERVDLDSSALREATAAYRLSMSQNDQHTAALQSAISHKVQSLQHDTNAYLRLARKTNGVEPQQIDSLSATVTTLVQQTQQIIKQPAETVFGSIEQTNQKLEAAIGGLTNEEQAAITDKRAAISLQIDHIKKLFILMTLGVTMAAILISVTLARSIAASLIKLRKSAQRIANGDFSVPIVAKGKDEIGQLSRSFNEMAERLRDSYRRLAIEQQRDEAILQGMGEGLIATDENGNILIINQNAAEYFNVTDQAVIIGKPIQELYQLYDTNDKGEKPLTPEQRPVFVALSSRAAVHDVFAFKDAGGKKSLLDITATPIVVTDKVVGAISIIRDVTREKEIDRMKTEFISLASHQLRTPLSAIKWFTEMLVSGDAGQLSPEQLEFAKNIDDSTERMIALVNALLNISRIESGRIIIDPQPTNLKELVSGIITDLRAKTEQKEQTLVISVHQDLPKINLDPRLIGQVYLNLLTNAIKYTPKGGEISVFISKKDDQIISQVTDNGYGIPKEEQGRVFQKFFRAANAVKVETDGTGLGLYLIKAVVESSGGKIWFESEEGKGTTFWFSIPLSGMKPKQGEVTLDA